MRRGGDGFQYARIVGLGIERPAGLAENRFRGILGVFVPDREEGAIGELDGGGVAEIGGYTVVRNGDGLGPGGAVVIADAGLVAVGLRR